MNDTVPEAGRAPSVLVASLLGRCPRCGKGSLFGGYLNVARSCSACGLDFTGFEAGDGPAVFVILIVGAIVAGGALIVEVSFQPPYWVHALIWGPALLILSLGLLRPLKAALIVLQYKHRAEEGRRVN
jgi:uncharacterized protein (DUF983 family)